MTDVCVTYTQIDRTKGPRAEPIKAVSTSKNKAGYTVTLVVCGWAGAVIKVIWAFGQEK